MPHQVEDPSTAPETEALVELLQLEHRGPGAPTLPGAPDGRTGRCGWRVSQRAGTKRYDLVRSATSSEGAASAVERRRPPAQGLAERRPFSALRYAFPQPAIGDLEALDRPTAMHRVEDRAARYEQFRPVRPMQGCAARPRIVRGHAAEVGAPDSAHLDNGGDDNPDAPPNSRTCRSASGYPAPCRSSIGGPSSTSWRPGWPSVRRRPSSRAGTARTTSIPTCPRVPDQPVRPAPGIGRARWPSRRPRDRSGRHPPRASRGGHCRLIHATDAAGRRVSLVDFNRSGLPLMEIVTEPDCIGRAGPPLRGRAAAAARRVGASDAAMEEGQMRVEANVSLRPRGLRSSARASRSRT